MEISIRIKKDDKVVKYVQVLRKYCRKTISEIKDNIDKEMVAIKCDSYNISELVNLLDVYEELKKVGAIVSLYEDERQVEDEAIYNLIQMYDEIDRERQEIDDIIFD